MPFCSEIYFLGWYAYISWEGGGIREGGLPLGFIQVRAGPEEYFCLQKNGISKTRGLEMGPVNLRVIKCCQVNLYMNQTSYPPKSHHILRNITPKQNRPHQKKTFKKYTSLTFKSHPTRTSPQKTPIFFLRREFLLRPKSHPSILPCVSGIVTILSLFLSCGPWAPRSFLFVSYFGPLFRLVSRVGPRWPSLLGRVGCVGCLMVMGI